MLTTSRAGPKKIYANPGTITGSIGVIMEFANLSKLYDWAKIQRYSIKTGQFKDIGAEYREMAPDERALLQNMVDDVLVQFKTAVSTGRKLSMEDVTAIADGRIFSGSQAKKAHLVDELGTLDDAINEAGKMAGIKGKPNVVYPSNKKKRLLDFFMNQNDDDDSESGSLQGWYPWRLPAARDRKGDRRFLDAFARHLLALAAAMIPRPLAVQVLTAVLSDGEPLDQAARADFPAAQLDPQARAWLRMSVRERFVGKVGSISRSTLPPSRKSLRAGSQNDAHRSLSTRRAERVAPALVVSETVTEVKKKEGRVSREVRQREPSQSGGLCEQWRSASISGKGNAFGAGGVGMPSGLVLAPDFRAARRGVGARLCPASLRDRSFGSEWRRERRFRMRERWGPCVDRMRRARVERSRDAPDFRKGIFSFRIFRARFSWLKSRPK